MYSRASFVVRTIVVAAAAFALLLVGLGRVTAVEEGVPPGENTAQAESGDDGPDIQATQRISIPYGFTVAAPIPAPGQPITASGFGACTDGEMITIYFSVTQTSTGATASGEWNGECTGQIQTWTGQATLDTSSPYFAGGLAEGCAFAETRDGENVTATQSWCDPMILTDEPLERVFAPAVLKP